MRRLPTELQTAHAEWADVDLADAPLATARRNARRVAFTLLEQGDDADHVEHVLHGIGFHPAICARRSPRGRTNATAKPLEARHRPAPIPRT